MNEQGDKGERSISRWWISPADKYAIRFDFSDGAGKANRAAGDQRQPLGAWSTAPVPRIRSPSAKAANRVCA